MPRPQLSTRGSSDNMGKKRPLQNDPHSKGDKKRKKDEEKIEVNAQEDNETALSELWEK